MSTVTIQKTKTSIARLRLAGAAAAASLALTDAQVPAHVMEARREALQMLEQIISEGSASVDQLRTIEALLEGFAGRLMQDCIGAKQAGANWASTLYLVADELKAPTVGYQPGRTKPAPYQPLA